MQVFQVVPPVQPQTGYAASDRLCSLRPVMQPQTGYAARSGQDFDRDAALKKRADLVRQQRRARVNYRPKRTSHQR